MRDAKHATYIYDMHNIKELAALLGVPYLDEIDSALFDPALIAALPVTWARERVVLPARRNGEAVLLIADPAASSSALQHASIVAGADLAPVFAPREAILAAIDRAYYEGKKTGGDALSAQEAAQEAEPAEGGAARAALPANAARGAVLENDLLVDQSERPVAQFLNSVLLDAVRKDVSDVHMEPDGAGGTRVRYRIDGTLYDQLRPPREFAAPLASRVKVMAGMDIAERRLPQDGMARARVGEKIIDIRVSTVPVADGERVVMRLLNRDRSLLPLSALGMPDKALAGFSSLLALPNGMVVVSGPTGSGKTTTLYSALGSLDSARRNVMTIEDPVEYRLPEIGQIQVKPAIGLTFSAGLRHILRQDPDVVLVGETRDAETAEIAVRASLTGHLVFTTLHTNDAASAVMRLADMGVEPYLIASCLRGVIAQRLVRRLCPFCAMETAAAALPAAERAAALDAGCASVKTPAGCPKCLEGYAGRIGVFEFMPCGSAISDAVHGGRLSASILREIASHDPHACAMREDAYAKLRAGATSPAEVIAAVGAAAG